MFRSASAILLLVMTLAAPALAQGAPRHRDQADEALIGYLERNDLHELLASHLEAQLRANDGRRRIELAQRLSNTYATLHARATTLDAQRQWEGLGLALLERYPEADSIDFRLSLAQTSYRRLEQMAEESLLRLDAAPERTAVIESLVELLETLESIAGKADRRVDSFQRQLESARAEDSRLIDEALAMHQRYRSQASYLAGYTALYIARLARDRTSAASRAALHFSTVLNARQGQAADPQQVPPDLLAFDHVARSALGSAHAAALKLDVPECERWFSLLESAPDLSEAVELQLASSKLRAYAVANRWAKALAHLDALGEAPLAPLDARRLAVLVFEGSSLAVEQGARDALAQRALSDLIGHGETGHVLQVVAQFDITEINPTGFVGTYVRALKRYETARDLHRDEPDEASSPVTSDELAALYVRAADEFTNALDAPDAANYPRAEGSVRMLAGLSYHYAGPRFRNLINAADQFVLTSELLAAADPARAANALWMAIRSLELHIEGTNEDLDNARVRHATLLEDFLARYPDHPRAHSLAYQRATSGELPDEQAIDELLGIPETSTLHLTARRHATRMLYDMLTDESRASDSWRRTLFLDLAEVLMEQDLREALPANGASGDREAARRAALHARRLFEVALATPPRDDDRAERALDTLSTLSALGLLDIEAIEAELHYRRAKLLAARGDLDGAREASDRAGESDARFALAGDQLLFRKAVEAFEGADAPDEERAALLAQDVVDAGRPLLRELSEAERGFDFDDPGQAALAYRVAVAADALWEIRRDTEMRALAHVLFRRLARAHPHALAYIRPAARLERDTGNPLEALGYWRTILAATDPLSEPWLEAKHAIIEAQIPTDPSRAREILEQFDTLHPEFDHPGWAPRFARLRELLGRAGS